MSYLVKVADIVADVAQREDKKLKQVGRGIFLMQELAFSYLVGLELANNAKNIFGTDQVEWWTEKKVDFCDGLSRCDLIIKPFNKDLKGFVFEFKTRGSVEGWLADIDKLRKLQSNVKGQQKYDTFFCSLADVNCDQVIHIEEEKRVATIDNENDATRIKPTHQNYFDTQNYGYSGIISCFVALWQIKPFVSEVDIDSISF